MTKISFDSPDLAATQAWAASLANTFTNAMTDEVEAHSEVLQEDIAAAMPVDTGWAQGRWGDPAAGGGIWEVTDNGLSIEQGSSLSDMGLYEYIIRLNEGSSKQAPAGFIDSAAMRIEDKFVARIEQIIGLIDNG